MKDDLAGTGLAFVQISAKPGLLEMAFFRIEQQNGATAVFGVGLGGNALG